MAAIDVLRRVQADGKITRDEFFQDSTTTILAAQTLEDWGKVRSAVGSSGSTSSLEISGVGEWTKHDDESRYGWQKDIYTALENEFVFPILKDDGQRVSSPGVTSADVRRAQFSGEDEAVSQMEDWARSSASASSGPSDSGLSKGALAVVAALVIGAVAVFGGN